ncbi:MAG: hypothetical protein ACI4SG_08670, partial [Oligosphaeraceae bacterium]
SARNSRYAKLVTEMDASGNISCDLRYITGMLQRGSLPGNTVSLEDASIVTLEEGAAERQTRGRVLPTPAGYNTITQQEQFSITDSREFRDWFGKSKVVDEAGNPLVVYHGSRTGANIKIFQTPNARRKYRYHWIRNSGGWNIGCQTTHQFPTVTPLRPLR